jgi:hypothetical protein
MARTKLDMLHSFRQEIEAAAGPEIGRQVMSELEGLTANSPPVEVARWVKQAVERLDALASEEIRSRIMEACGENCTRINSSVITRAKVRRAKFDDELAFLEAEKRKPQAGTRLEQEGNILIQTYLPQSFTHPMRCFCALLRDLPADEQVSLTYCNCYRAFVQTYWSEVLGRPVKVDILETAVSGSTECKFRITK